MNMDKVLVPIPDAANHQLPDPSLLQFYHDLNERIYWVNDEIPEIEINSEYVIAIWDNIAVMTKIRTINPHPNA